MAVVLVSNPERAVSTHSWAVDGVSRLTRENKLTSLPFWVPNDQMKTHQFRLVLLKGLVPAAKPEDDPFGIVLELVPPPTDPASDRPASSQYPGGCYVTASVVNRSRPGEGNIVASQTVLMDEEGAQVSFPELLPAAAAKSAEYAQGEPAVIVFELTIRTGVNVFAQQVTTSVSSLWASLTTSVAKLIDTTTKVYHEGRAEFEGVVNPPQEAASPPMHFSPPPWEVVPAKWSARAADWHELTRNEAAGEDGTFLYGPGRTLTDDERQLLLQAGFNYRALVELYNQFSFDRDVHEGLLASDAIRQQRYHLVPAKVKEGLFWANYFWKVACLATCEDRTQVRSLLTVLNAPPAAAPRAPDPAVEGLSEEAVMQTATDAQEAADLLLEYLHEGDRDDDVFLMETAASTCEDHVKRLEPQFRRTDLTENTLVVVGATLRRLRERIAKYHETVAKRAATLETAAANAKSTPPPPAEEAAGSDVGSTHEKPAETSTPITKAQSPPAVDAPAAPEHLDAPSPEPAAPPAASTNPSVARPRSGSATVVDLPKMPWEEEDDDDS